MARHQARVFASTALLLAGFPAALFAQAAAPRGNANAPKMMVAICRNADKKLGPDAADALRDKTGGELSTRDLYVVPKQDVTNSLEQSGYSVTDALNATDANALAKTVHADMYIECNVNKTATGFQIEAWLILTRDQNLIQPLGAAEHAKLDGAAGMISKEFRNAFKAFEPEKLSRLRLREGKPAEAIKLAADGLSQYPKSVWLRADLMNVAVEQKRSADVIKYAEEIRAIDPKNPLALRELFKQYDIAKNTDKKLEMLREMFKADPTNPTLQRQVANELAAAGKFSEAEPILMKAVSENQGDVALVQTYFNVLGALNKTKLMAQVGLGMIQMDSSLADQDFYDRMVSAYAADSDWAHAAEMAAKVAAKFPKVADNWVRLGGLQRRLGQSQQSVESLKRALAIDPKIKNARMIIINALVDQVQYDSAMVAVREALKAGEDPDQLGLVANVMANRSLSAAQKTKTIVDFKKVLPFANFADSAARDRAVKNNAKFLIGVTSAMMAQIYYTDATTNKGCDDAKTANSLAVDASLNLPIGGATSPEVVRQLMPMASQIVDASAQAMKAFCRADTPAAAAAPPKKPPTKTKKR